jgi:hypothetical protein
MAARQNMYLAFTLLSGAISCEHSWQGIFHVIVDSGGITLMAVTNKSLDEVKHTYKLYVMYCVHFE